MLQSFFPRGLAAPALLLLLAASTSAQEHQGKRAQMVLAVGDPTPCPADARVSVTLLRVATDSRCPRDVLGVRAGGVCLELEARRGTGAPVAFTIDMDRGDGTAEACGVHFRLVRVEPLRVQGQTLAQDCYRVTVQAVLLSS